MADLLKLPLKSWYLYFSEKIVYLKYYHSISQHSFQKSLKIDEAVVVEVQLHKNFVYLPIFEVLT